MELALGGYFDTRNPWASDRQDGLGLLILSVAVEPELKQSFV